MTNAKQTTNTALASFLFILFSHSGYAFVPSTSMIPQTVSPPTVLHTVTTSHSNEVPNGDNADKGAMARIAALLIPDPQVEQKQFSTNPSRRRFRSRRPSIETGRRYRSKDWLTNLLSLPNSFVLRRIKFHLVTNTLLSLAVVLVDRFYFPLSIPTTAHTLVGR